MSVEQEVAEVLSNTAEASTVKARANLDLAQQEVNKMLSVTNSSIFESKDDLKGCNTSWI